MDKTFWLLMGLALVLTAIYVVTFYQVAIAKKSPSVSLKSESTWLKILMIVSSIGVWVVLGYLFFFYTPPGKVSFYFSIVTSAFAETSTTPQTRDVGVFVNFIVGAIFLVFLIGLCFSMYVLFTTDDDAKNKAKIAAADTIFKTFSGFLIGVLTAFVKQAFG